jgi:glycosyltransferase involved in cell wall biosynthesis
MKIAYITAGAAGSFCGSCMRDNTLVAALRQQGHDAVLIPTYTPIRTDETDVSYKRIFFGGINVFLQDKLSFFRHTPWFLDRLLDAPGLIRWLSTFAGKTQAAELVDLTLSMLRGEHGRQRKEFEKLIAWLKDELQPDIVVLTNVLLSGLIPPLKEALKRPVVAVLQGDDIFLDGLPAAARAQAIMLIRNNCIDCDRYIATCRAYAEFMSTYLGVPRDKIDVVYPGIKLNGYAPKSPRPTSAPFTIGYFARICPEKGLHVLVDAFCELKRQRPDADVRLRVAGYFGPAQEEFLAAQEAKLAAAGLTHHYAHVDCPSHDDKVRFLHELDVLSVPTTYREPKGLYVLEAWASGVPVVQPSHGSFPELVGATGGGVLVEPENPAALARAILDLHDRRDEAQALGKRGQDVVTNRFHAAAMATETTTVLTKTLKSIIDAQAPG